MYCGSKLLGLHDLKPVESCGGGKCSLPMFATMCEDREFHPNDTTQTRRVSLKLSLQQLLPRLYIQVFRLVFQSPSTMCTITSQT